MFVMCLTLPRKTKNKKQLELRELEKRILEMKKKFADFGDKKANAFNA